LSTSPRFDKLTLRQAQRDNDQNVVILSLSKDDKFTLRQAPRDNDRDLVILSLSKDGQYIFQGC